MAHWSPAHVLCFLRDLFPELFLHIAINAPWIQDVTVDTLEEELTELCGGSLPYVQLSIERRHFFIVRDLPGGETMMEYQMGARGRNIAERFVWFGTSLCLFTTQDLLT